MNSTHEVIIIGAGHAGLSISYFLRQAGIQHVVLERGRVGESWRSQRWDSFVVNTPNKMTLLPGDTYTGDHPDGFPLRDEFVQSLQRYADTFALPVIEGVTVTSVSKADDENGFVVKSVSDGVEHVSHCQQLVIASGNQNTERIPGIASAVDPSVQQFHASRYRNPEQLPDGGVLIVGSGQSGCQIAEDLLAAGRKVWLSTSRVPRCPRRYRGKDILEWMNIVGFLDATTDSITDPQLLAMKQPQISGVGPLGRTISLQSLARQGAVILGRVESASDTVVKFQSNAAEHVQFADGFSQKIKGMIEGFIAKTGLTVQPPEPDPADEPDPTSSCASSITELNLPEQGITSIIWATGFGGEFGWLHLPVLDEHGMPVHNNGVTSIPGLYVLGFPWLRKRKSGIVFGIAEDAEAIAKMVVVSG